MSTQLRQIFDAITDNSNDYCEDNMSSEQNIIDYAENGMNIEISAKQAGYIQTAYVAYTCAANNSVSESGQWIVLDRLINAILDLA